MAKSNRRKFGGEYFYFYNSYNPTAKGDKTAMDIASRLRKLNYKVRVIQEGNHKTLFTRPEHGPMVK